MLISIPVCSFNTEHTYVTWLLTFILILVMFVKFLLSKKIVINSFIFLSFLFLGISMLLSSILNLNGAFTLTPFLLIGVILYFFSFFLLFKELRKLAYYLSYLSLVIFLAIFIFLYRNELLNGDFYRLGDAFGDQNNIAMFISLGTCFSIYLILFKKNILVKIFCFIFLVLFVFCGFSTGSKLFLFTLIGCLIFLIFSLCGKKWWL